MPRDYFGIIIYFNWKYLFKYNSKYAQEGLKNNNLFQLEISFQFEIINFSKLFDMAARDYF